VLDIERVTINWLLSVYDEHYKDLKVWKLI